MNYNCVLTIAAMALMSLALLMALYAILKCEAGVRGLLVSTVVLTAILTATYKLPPIRHGAMLYRQVDGKITSSPWGESRKLFKGGQERSFAVLSSPTVEVRTGYGKTYVTVTATLTKPDRAVSDTRYCIWPSSQMISDKISLLPLELEVRDKLTPFVKDADEVLSGGMDRRDIFDALKHKVDNLRPFGEDVTLNVVEMYRSP